MTVHQPASSKWRTCHDWESNILIRGSTNVRCFC